MIKKILKVGIGVGMALLPFSAFAGTIATVDASFITSMLAYVGNVWTDFILLTALAIGLPLGFWVVRKVIGLVRAR